MSIGNSSHRSGLATRARGLANGALLIAAAVLTLATSPTPGTAQLVFTDQATFLAALASSQTYTAAASCTVAGCPGNPPVSATPIRLFSAGPLAVASGALWVHLPTNQLFNYGGGPVFGFNPDAPSGDEPFVTFASPTPVYAFGVHFGEPTRPAPLIQSTFTFTLGNGLTFARQALGSGSPEPGPPPLAFEFFGVISPTPFDRFTIAASNAESFGAINSVAFDDITVGVVPEPRILWLLGAGALVLAVLGRRRPTVPGGHGSR